MDEMKQMAQEFVQGIQNQIWVTKAREEGSQSTKQSDPYQLAMVQSRCATVINKSSSTEQRAWSTIEKYTGW